MVGPNCTMTSPKRIPSWFPPAKSIITEPCFMAANISLVISFRAGLIINCQTYGRFHNVNIVNVDSKESRFQSAQWKWLLGTVFDLIDMYVMRGLSVLRYPTASSSAQTTQLFSSLLNYYSLVSQRWSQRTKINLCIESIGRRYIVHGVIQFFYDTFLSCGTSFALVANEDKIMRKEYFYISNLPLNFL